MQLAVITVIISAELLCVMLLRDRHLKCPMTPDQAYKRFLLLVCSLLIVVTAIIQESMIIYMFAFNHSIFLFFQDILKGFINEAKNETSSTNVTPKNQQRKGLVGLVFLDCFQIIFRALLLDFSLNPLFCFSNIQQVFQFRLKFCCNH